MPKQKFFKPRATTQKIRNALKFFYLEKFFNKWMSKYDFLGLNYQQKHYIMKKFWSIGSVACSKFAGGDKMSELMSGGIIDLKEDTIIFSPWTFANRYNIYDFPTHIRLTNTRTVQFISNEELELDVEAVILYAQKNHKSVFSSISAKIDEIIDLEMKKRVALKSQSQPWTFVFDSEDYVQAKALQRQLEEDEPYCFIQLKQVDKAKTLTSGAPYIVDKIQAQIDGRVDEVLTMLGVNNLGVDEKKEHLVVDEINANNEDIEQQSYSFKSEIEDGFERVSKVLGYKVQVVDLNDMFKEAEDEVDEKEEDDEDESIYEN